MMLNRNTERTSVKLARGFTLIELVIVMAIIGILAAIAYPSYTEYVTKARRADGKAALLEEAARQERFFFANTSYTTTPQAGTSSTEGHYGIAVIAGPTTSITTSYKITATPTQTDANCTTLTLDSQGNKDATGANTARCW